MTEVFRVEPYRSYPGPKSLDFGAIIPVVAVNISGLRTGTTTEVRTREVRPFGYYVDGMITLDRYALKFKGIKSYSQSMVPTLRGAFPVVVSNYADEILITFGSMRNGLDILLPDPKTIRKETPPEREYRCLLYPPDRLSP